MAKAEGGGKHEDHYQYSGIARARRGQETWHPDRSGRRIAAEPVSEGLYRYRIR